MEYALVCPQCNAPLVPHRFAQSAVCSYCGTTVRFDDLAVSVTRFHEAYRVWNSPESYQITSWVSIGDTHWASDRLIAHGDISDVYAGQRARWPTELVILKLLRDRKYVDRFDNEWVTLQELHRSNVPGADTFTALIPQPVIHGNISAGPFDGKRVTIFRSTSGFHHTFDDVIRAYPQGIPPRASIWMWRRILEVLSFLHTSGIVHGAILPSNLLIQENEHGVHLVGYSCSGRIGDKLRAVSQGFKPFYPQPAGSPLTMTPQLDLMMSARCIAAVLGGNLSTVSLPSAVPALLANIVQRVALLEPTDARGEVAWTIREELGEIAKQVFGPPKFIPIAMHS